MLEFTLVYGKEWMEYGVFEVIYKEYTKVQWSNICVYLGEESNNWTKIRYI